MTQGDRRWEQMSDAEFLADYEARHGRAAMEKVAKALAMDPPPRGPLRAGPKAATRVGAKPKKRMALTQNLVPRQGPSARELHERIKQEGPPPERASIMVAVRGGTCSARGCGERFEKGEEVMRLYPSRRIVHGRCARAAAQERCEDFEARQAAAGDVTPHPKRPTTT